MSRRPCRHSLPWRGVTPSCFLAEGGAAIHTAFALPCPSLSPGAPHLVLYPGRARPKPDAAYAAEGGSGAGPMIVRTVCAVVEVMRKSVCRSAPPQQRLPQTSGVATVP